MLDLRPSVPILRSSRIVDQDPFFSNKEKGFLKASLTLDKPMGMLSVNDLASTAMKAGVGYAVSSMFASSMSSVLGLPEPLARAASKIGGLSGAVYNSGIFKNM